jgi:putative ABC transport system ATP-binding protein
MLKELDLNPKPEKTDGLPGKSGEMEHPSPDYFLSLIGLTKGFQEGERYRLVLDGASASIDKGESVAILGRSGSGKSTLLNIISGIDRVDDGEVWLDGENLTRMDERHRTLFRRNHIGFVFQFFNLIATLTVWENVILPLELSAELTPQVLARAEFLLESVGLIDRRDTFPDRLSGGEQQRVAIARALVHDPLLVLADEPTGNLDEDTGRTVMDLLDHLTRQAGKNLLMVTHSQGAAGYADRILLLRDGRLFDPEP